MTEIQWPEFQPVDEAAQTGGDFLVVTADGHVMTAFYDKMLGWTDNARGTFWGFDVVGYLPLPSVDQDQLQKLNDRIVVFDGPVEPEPSEQQAEGEEAVEPNPTIDQDQA
ncbi:hypothetical protein [Asticcacaulis solisilvae]|uniref:hypothetical protein n=1 Tax=Asticcacaulis solisilvae TaxID=1217274 RepID=UPI003FD77543